MPLRTRDSDIYRLVVGKSGTATTLYTNGSLVFEARDIDVPASWSQVARTISAKKPITTDGMPASNSITGSGTSICGSVTSRTLSN